ncbi:flavodoxin family protein [Methanobrevibacter olleyae]|uniref:NADPH-dependent FMN reductase n=1 Tax=Methanobrevibacter olleyae TaxID=294671 RepID=A0A126R1G6_METOL|nr:NAD(P)H-dependent oxidoreductase [Methanobrevibacter olleyae]AMK15485.1 NADPH-dependent FMN reductase [Methanobrevibacter olleyae]SFL38421.1 NADPH-dependent FMN reductase [Methanobrevibacter olleyae]
MKKIMILNGAARKKGNTAGLINSFKEGALSSGNEIREFYLQTMNIKGCLGCLTCIENNGKCIQEDDMKEVCEAFNWADVLVFASPVYFGTITGTLKTAIDRLYSEYNPRKVSKIKKETVLIMTAGAPIYEIPLMWYSIFERFMGWKNLGSILGSEKIEEAKNLGKSIK